MKKCTACEKTKPPSDFGKHARAADGLRNECLSCKRQREKRWREANSEKRKEQIKRSKLKNPETVKRANRAYRERYPERTKAQGILYYAIKCGHVAKPNRCEKCGKPCKSRELDAHHHDYDKPLDVRWLCRQCHVDIQREEASDPQPKPEAASNHLRQFAKAT